MKQRICLFVSLLLGIPTISLDAQWVQTYGPVGSITSIADTVLAVTWRAFHHMVERALPKLGETILMAFVKQNLAVIAVCFLI